MIYQVWGANTNVGKTMLSAILLKKPGIYLKPVQTGPITDKATILCIHDTHKQIHSIFNFTSPESPHSAAIKDSKLVSDYQIIQQLRAKLNSLHDQKSLVYIETAGGVNSPLPSGSLQADVYRYFRFPSILVGDSQLGGISTTLSAYESLKIRGFDVPLLFMFENKKYLNHELIAKYVDRDTKIFTVPAPPLVNADARVDVINLRNYVKGVDVDEVISYLHKYHSDRYNRLQQLNKKGGDQVWWPFTQHKLIKSSMVIDSAYKDNFTVFDELKNQPDPSKLAPESTSFTKELFDGCASWWTQGLGHGNPQLAKTAAYAAGRYGHVISPECIHEPAYELAQKLLNTAGKGWAKRVFYSDNGSTAVEVAVKMALAKTYSDYKNKNGKAFQGKWDIIGIKDSYHGDTIGAMDLSDPNDYNKKVHWYQGRGYWFSIPTFIMKNGKYSLRFPSELSNAPETSFSTMSDIFSSSRNDTDLFKFYTDHINIELARHLSKNPTHKFGGVIIEPLILGAGGMKFVDPLFHKALIKAVRNRCESPIPVIFDEVFVGMYRLGSELASVNSYFKTSNEHDNFSPDIACYAKALTGGILPLSATLATREIFEVFVGDSKLDSLLHGHSYTAHPIGCSVAVKSLEIYEQNKNVERKWDDEFVKKLSFHPKVEGVNALGTVLVIELLTPQKGYSSTAAVELIKNLKSNHGIFTRPLGNVVYFMMGHLTEKSTVREISERILIALDQLK